MAPGSFSHSRVDPTMSVKRKVTVPAGSSASPGVWGGSWLTGDIAPVPCESSFSRPVSPPAPTIEPCGSIRLMSTGRPTRGILRSGG